MAKQVVKIVSLQAFQAYLRQYGARLQPDGTYKTVNNLIVKGFPEGVGRVKMVVTTCDC